METSQLISNARKRLVLQHYEQEIEKSTRVLAGVFKRLRDDKEKPWEVEGYESFEDYCERRWGMTLRRQQQILAAESVRDMLMSEPATAEIAPSLNERQLREVANIPPEKRTEVMAKAASSGKITASNIKRIAVTVVPSLAQADINPLEDDAPKVCPTCKQAIC